MKLADRGHDVTVLERNPPGVTYGWGVVFWDDLLDTLHRNDPVTARQVAAASVAWNGQEVRVRGGRTVYLGGSGFSVGRKRLLDILADRAVGLGVSVQFRHEVEEAAQVAGADLVVACDGVNSRIREQHAQHFRTQIDFGRNKYIWLGTDRVFDAFTFAFEKTAAGWIWFHAYHFDRHNSTCIVECSPETWRELGLHSMDREPSIRLLERVFAPYLDGCSLIDQRRDVEKAPWLNFKRVMNERWYDGNIVLMGDAAHTTHFAIGSGTRLALLDAATLADCLQRHGELPQALQAYESQRRAELAEVQSSADRSTHWFEQVDRYVDGDPVMFAFSLWKRRGDVPPWRLPLHLATQMKPVRKLRRLFTLTRTLLRATRRRLLAQHGPTP
jgi:2-polyprenyl-6-methoxyphenol hydroxylase-like FAD-dependent oxidoreductase